MKLTIRAPGLQRLREARGIPLRLVGGVVGVLAGGVRRVTLRIRPGDTDRPRAILVIEREDRVSSYQFEGRVARWALVRAATLGGGR